MANITAGYPEYKAVSDCGRITARANDDSGTVYIDGRPAWRVTNLPILLKAYRARHSLTQERLAMRWDVPLNTVKGWEAGKPTTHQSALEALLREVNG